MPTNSKGRPPCLNTDTFCGGVQDLHYQERTHGIRTQCVFLVFYIMVESSKLAGAAFLVPQAADAGFSPINDHKNTQVNHYDSNDGSSKGEEDSEEILLANCCECHFGARAV